MRALCDLFRQAMARENEVPLFDQDALWPITSSSQRRVVWSPLSRGTAGGEQCLVQAFVAQASSAIRPGAPATSAASPCW